MKRRAIMLTAIIMGLLMTAPAGAAEYNYQLMSGPMGGSWYPLGGAIAEILNKSIPGLTIGVQPGAGITNVKAVGLKKTELGFSNACSAVDGILGRAPFTEETTNVKHMLTLYYQYFQATVPKDIGIKSIGDLKGKRICPMPKGNTGEQMSRHALQVYGLSYNDMAKVNYGSYTDSVNLIKDGHADVYLPVTTVPASSIMDLNSVRPVRILAFPDDKIAALQKINSGYKKRVIPANSYDGVDYDVPTFGTYTHLIVGANVPDDLVYKMTAILVENVGKLSQVVTAMKGANAEFMASDVGVPYHAGAMKYFKEKGLIK